MRFLSAALFWLVSGLSVLAVTPDDEQRARLMAADIVLLGEVHDNPAHHEGQGALLRMIAPRAVVFEMLTPEMADWVAARDVGDLDSLDRAIGWTESGWPPMVSYGPVFEALGAAAIVGAAVPRDAVRAAFAEGAAAVFGAEAARYGLTDPLPEAERAVRTDLQFEAHCRAMPRGMMDGMIEAQRLRDARFAQAALDALRTHGGPVAVIAGHGHVRRDWGMPALIALAAPDVTVVSVGFLEDPAPAADARFDITFVTAPAPRGDPCAAFN